MSDSVQIVYTAKECTIFVFNSVLPKYCVALLSLHPILLLTFSRMTYEQEPITVDYRGDYLSHSWLQVKLRLNKIL